MAFILTRIHYDQPNDSAVAGAISIPAYLEEQRLLESASLLAKGMQDFVGPLVDED